LVGNDGSVLQGSDSDPDEDFAASFNLPGSTIAVRVGPDGGIEYEETFEAQCLYYDVQLPCLRRFLCVKRADGTVSVERNQQFFNNGEYSSDTEIYGPDGHIVSREHIDSAGTYLEEFERGEPLGSTITRHTDSGDVIVEYVFEHGECARVIETIKDLDGKIVSVVEKDCSGNILRRTDYTSVGETVMETLFDDDGNIAGYRITVRTSEGEQTEMIDPEGRPLQNSARKSTSDTGDMEILGSKFAKPIVKFY